MIELWQQRMEPNDIGRQEGSSALANSIEHVLFRTRIKHSLPTSTRTQTFQDFSMVVKLENILESASSTAAAGGEILILPNLLISAVSELKAYKNDLIFPYFEKFVQELIEIVYKSRK